MRIFASLALMCLTFSGVASPAAAAEPVGQVIVPVTVPNSRQIDFVSKVTGRPYRMMIAMPEGPPPQGGYPVLYVIDGGFHFLTATGVMLRQVGHNIISPPIVVGIGYQEEGLYAAGHMRTFDLTLPMEVSELQHPMFSDNGVTRSEHVGGLDNFLLMLRTEVRERVFAIAPIDRSQQVLFGHSLGGLAVVRQLLRDPGVYSGYIASSPSIWLKNRAVLADLPELQAKLLKLERPPVVFLGVGEKEADLGIFGSLVSNTVSLYEHLFEMKGIQTTIAIVPEEDHASSVASTISRGVQATLQLRKSP